jgi:hypothetical protein
MSIALSSTSLAWSRRPIPHLLILAVVACSGCYSPGRSRLLTEAPPVEESVRSNFGRVGLLLPEFSPAFVFQFPRNIGEAMENAAEKTWEFGDWDDGVDDFAAGLFISGLFGVIGGAITGVPQQEMDAAEKELRLGLRENPLLLGISNRVQSFVKAQGHPPLVIVPPELAAALNSADLATRDYRPLVPLGIDSVMEIVVERHGFQARESSNPSMTMEAIFHVHITRVSDGALLFTTPIHYQGHKHRFTEWAEDDARKFRSELRRVGRMVGRGVVEQVLIPTRAGLN